MNKYLWGVVLICLFLVGCNSDTDNVVVVDLSEDSLSGSEDPSEDTASEENPEDATEDAAPGGDSDAAEDDPEDGSFSDIFGKRDKSAVPPPPVPGG